LVRFEAEPPVTSIDALIQRLGFRRMQSKRCLRRARPLDGLARRQVAIEANPSNTSGVRWSFDD